MLIRSESETGEVVLRQPISIGELVLNENGWRQRPLEVSCLGWSVAYYRRVWEQTRRVRPGSIDRHSPLTIPSLLIPAWWQGRVGHVGKR